jgi:hypothetical protein
MMKTKTLCLTILLAGFLVASFSPAVFAKKNACGKEMTASEMAERAMDFQEIQNVMGYHQLYGAPGGDHDKELDLIWAQKTPDVSFASNRGVYQGDIDVIYSYYGSGSRKAGKKDEKGTAGMTMQAGGGNTSFRALTTPIIEVAGDGKTAKAYWYTPGWQANMQNGQGNAIWSFEKYAIDFVKEDGVWKIWHFHVYNDWEIPMTSDLAQYAIEQSKKEQNMPPRKPREDLAKYYKDIVFNQAYSVTRPPNPLNPRPPVPYCTFKDTFSYAEE